MARFILKRILQIIPMLLVVTIFAFCLSNLASGDIAEISIRSSGGQVTPENLAQARIDLGLDQPLVIQYFNWLGKAVRFDFGNSFISGKPVINEIMSRFPNTLYLVLIASIMAIVIAVPIALLSARYSGSILDQGLRVVTTIGATMPEFWLGLLLLYVFAIHLGIVPVIAGSNIANIFLPAFTLCLSYSAVYVRMLRTNLIEVRRSNYFKAARSKGMSEGSAMVRHGLKNAILPCVTLIATNFGGMISGGFAVETIFSWQGIGQLAVEAVGRKDYPVIQAIILWLGVLYVAVNFLVDLSYSLLDPRVRLGKGENK